MEDKKAPPTKTGKKVVEKQTPKGFVNWAIPLNSGGVYTSSKGFPIYQNPKFVNKQEDYLLALAEKHGGEVTVTMKVTVKLYTPAVIPSVDDITIL